MGKKNKKRAIDDNSRVAPHNDQLGENTGEGRMIKESEENKKRKK